MNLLASNAAMGKSFSLSNTLSSVRPGQEQGHWEEGGEGDGGGGREGVAGKLQMPSCVWTESSFCFFELFQVPEKAKGGNF